MRLEKMSFHYKEQAILIETDCDERLELLLNYYKKFIKEHKLHFTQYLEQLDLLVQDWNLVQSEGKLQNLFVYNVFVLTTMGIIKQDDFNGTNYMYKGV